MKKTVYAAGWLLGLWMNAGEAIDVPIVCRRRAKTIGLRKIRYGKDRHQVCRILYPKKEKEKRPLLIYLHGGGFVSGLTVLRDPYCIEYVEKGYVAVNIGYTYAPRKQFPEQFREIFLALEAVFDRARELEIDLNKIIVAGESAGGYLAFYTAAFSKDRSLYDRLHVSFRYRDLFDVKAVVSVCGIGRTEDAAVSGFPGIALMLRSFFGKTKQERDLLPEAEKRLLDPPVNAKVPPSVLIYAVKDPLKTATLRLAETLKQFEVPCLLLKADGLISRHALAIAPLFRKSRQLLRETHLFLDSVINHH